MQRLSGGDVSTLSTGFEPFLGAPDRRYFGHGYRRTVHKLSPVKSFSDGSLRAIGSAAYASDWSMKSGQARVPHLGSVDVVVLSAWIGQAFLDALGLNPEQIRRAWIHQFSGRTGSKPVTELSNIPMATRPIGTRPIDDLTQTSELRFRIGNFTGQFSIIHEIPTRGQTFSERFVASPAPDVYTALCQHTKQRAYEFHLSTDGKEVDCKTSLEAVAAAPAGLSGYYWPMPTLVDCLVICGQLSEVVAFSQIGVDREASANLWLRRVTVKAPSPAERALTGRSFIRLDDMKHYRHDGSTISTFETTMGACGVDIKFSLALAHAAQA